MQGIVLSALWMSGALVSFLSMALAGRELSAELTTLQILFFRSAIGVLIICAILAKVGWHHIRTDRVTTHIVRNIAHYIGQFGWFYAVAVIPLTQVFAIEFTIPIWTFLLAPLLLGERVTLMRLVVIGIGFIGVLVILRPGLVAFEIGAASALIAALGYALSHTLTKKLTATDTPLAVIFYMTVIQLPMGAIPSLWDWTTPGMAMWPWLVLVGVTALSAHYCMARAFAYADAIVVVPLDFLRLPLVAIIGLLFYDEPLDFWVILGATIIFAGSILNVLSERQPS